MSIAAVLLLVLNVMTVVSVATYQAVRDVVESVLSAASYAMEVPGWARTLRENESLAEERDSTRARLRAAEVELDRTEHELATVRSMRQADRARVVELERETSQTRRILERTNERLEEVSRIAREVDGAAARLRAEVHTVVARIQRRTARVMGVNFVAEPASAIPFLGAVTIGGLLSYELYSACETIVDLSELEGMILEAGASQAPTDASSCVTSMTEMLTEVLGIEPERAACYQARAQTHRLDPPECANFPFEFAELPSLEPVTLEPDPLPDLQPLPDLR